MSDDINPILDVPLPLFKKFTEQNLTSLEVATLLGRAHRTVQHWFRRGVLSGWQVGFSGHWRMSLEALLQYSKDEKIRLLWKALEEPEAQ